MKSKLWPSLACACFALGAIPIRASSIVTATYTDPSSFAAAVSGETTITFDGVAPIGSFVTYGSGGYTSNGVTFYGDNNGGFQEQIVDAAFQSPYNNWNSGGSLISAQYLNVPVLPFIQVVLPAGTTAFGVDLGSVSPNALNAQVLLSDGETFTVSTAARPMLTFFGLTASAALSYVDFSLLNTIPSNGSELSMDNFSFGTADQTQTPEAGTLALIGLGLVAMPFVRRKRTSKRKAEPAPRRTPLSIASAES